MYRVVADASEVRAISRGAVGNFPMARRAVFRNLAIQTERQATKLASGASMGPTRVKRGRLQGAGNYPIPVRTGRFRRGFGFRADANRAEVWNESDYAEALHEGFRPYNNPHAMPIAPRRYFDDAMDKLDLDEAQRAFDTAMAVKAAP